MASRKRGLRGRIVRYLERPGRIVGRLQVVWLAVVMLSALWNAGGHSQVAAGVWVMGWQVFVLGILHGVYWLTRKTEMQFNRWALLPLPLVCWAGLARYGAVAPWLAGLEFGILLQVYVVYFVALHSVRRARDLYYLMWALGLGSAMVYGGAIFELFFYPMWHAAAGFERMTPEVGDVAAGFFHAPERLAAAILLMMPVYSLVALRRRYAGPVRILSGFMAFAGLILLTMSSVALAMVAAGIYLLVLPVLVEERWRKRRLIWLWELLGLLLVFGMAWMLKTELRGALERLWVNVQAPLFGEGLWGIVGGQWLTGLGFGTLGVASDLAGLERWSALDAYPVAGLVGIWLQLGLIGVLVVVLPLGWLVIKVGKKVWAAPHMEYNADELSRMRKAGGSRNLRKQKRKLGRAPEIAVLGGGLLYGLIGVWVMGLGWSLSGSAYLSLALAVVLAVMANLEGSGRVDIRWGSRWRLVLFAVPVLVSGWALAVATPLGLAQARTAVATQALEAIEGRTDGLLFREPELLVEVINGYQLALAADERHGGALSGLGRALLAQRESGLKADRAVGLEALAVLERAVEVDRYNWRVHHDLGIAQRLAGAETAVVLGALETAIALGPGQVQAYTAAVELLMETGEAADVERAAALLAKAAEVDGADAEVRRLRGLMQLRVGGR